MGFHSLNFCLNFAVRRGVYEGREQAIIPCVILTEGVHAGSAGPLYYPSSELAKYPGAWNGVPVTLNHPEVNGSPVSANSPEIAEQALGRLWNVNFENGKLKGEVWIDLQKAQSHPEVMAYVGNGRVMEVSTGLWSDDEHSEGTWNGEEYQIIARNYRPDHLALLPNSRGACSVADGCGLGVNKLCQKGTETCSMTTNKKDHGVKMPEDHRGLMKRFMSFLSNEASFEEIRGAIQGKLDDLDTPTSFHFLRKVYDGYCVYEVGPGPESTGTPSRKLYRRTYSMTENGAELADDPVEVREETNYVEIRQNKETKTEEEEKMKDCKAKVNALITNGAFEESDRAMLEKMDCAAITRLGERVQVLSAKTEEKKEEKPAPAVNTEEKPNGDGKALSMSPGKVALEDLPEDVQEMIRANREEAQRNKADLSAKIMKVPGNKFTEETLKAMSVPTLRNILDMVKPPEADYSFMGGGFTAHAADDEEGLEIPTMNFGEDKDKK